jgi:alpha-tubulin suppressor-like RCC1 family protein
MAGCGAGENYEDNWRLHEDIWKNGDDKIIDIVAGKNSITAVTQAGKVWNQGYVSYRMFDEEERVNEQNNEDFAHDIKLPEGATNPRVFAHLK